MTSELLESAPPRTQRRRRSPRNRKRVLVPMIVLVVLVAAFFGGGGFYFAGQLEADGLAADTTAQRPTYDLLVDSYADGTVVLHRPGQGVPSDPLLSGETYGLTWSGGSGVLSGSPERREGGTVRRSLHMSAGTRPVAGTPAALTKDVWANPRAAYGVDYRDVTFPCAGGHCPAWFVPGDGSFSTWLVMVHGKGASRTEPLRAMGPAAGRIPTLDIEYRNDPDAPVDPSHRYAYGATEWRDLESAVRYAAQHGATSVVLFGSSMGGSVVASFLEHSQLASMAHGIILDAPALDFGATVDFGAEHRTLPLVGTRIPRALTATAKWIAAWRYDLDWSAVDYLPGAWLKVPALVFHGTADDTVPIATSDEFRAAHPELVREIPVRGATHVGSWNVDPEAYFARESEFLYCVALDEPRGFC